MESNEVKDQLQTAWALLQITAIPLVIGAVIGFALGWWLHG
jgi:ABC-type xylose transport system permease subunit